MNTALLNKLRKLMIDFANAKGISLADHFKDGNEFKQFIVAFAIKSMVDAGTTVRQAWDTVLGDGSYEDLVESVWKQAQQS